MARKDSPLDQEVDDEVYILGLVFDSEPACPKN